MGSSGTQLHFRRFHNDMVALVEGAVEDTHRVYCWVRKWSQMVLVLMRRDLSLFASCRPPTRVPVGCRPGVPVRGHQAAGLALPHQGGHRDLLPASADQLRADRLPPDP